MIQFVPCTLAHNSFSQLDQHIRKEMKSSMQKVVYIKTIISLEDTIDKQIRDLRKESSVSVGHLRWHLKHLNFHFCLYQPINQNEVFPGIGTEEKGPSMSHAL